MRGRANELCSVPLDRFFRLRMHTGEMEVRPTSLRPRAFLGALSLG
jgi:hypothetical protein